MPRKPPIPRPPAAADIDPLADLLSPPPAGAKRAASAKAPRGTAGNAAAKVGAMAGKAGPAPGPSGKPQSGKAASAKPASAKPASAKPASAKPASAKPASAQPVAGPAASAKTGGGRSAGVPVGRRAAPVEPPPAPRRNKAVANAAAAAHGKTVAAWSEAEVIEAFSRFEARQPEPQGELEHTDPYTLLVAVVLSAQATDSGVNRATRGLFAAASTPAAMVALGEEKVAHFIRTLGLFKTKAKNVVELSRLLVERHHGAVPRDRAALEELPGVGRKTANVVLNIAFGEPTIAVDTHLFRVANRTGLAPGPTPLAVEEALEARIPDRFKLHAHHWLILHGRYVCKARQPDCGHCLIADLCRWPEKQF